MKHILIPFLLMSSTAVALPTAKEIEEGCNIATHNVILAFKEAENNMPITTLLQQYPQHIQEILSGYKLHGAGNSEYEAYVIFKEYCLSLFKKA